MLRSAAFTSVRASGVAGGGADPGRHFQGVGTSLTKN